MHIQLLFSYKSLMTRMSDESCLFSSVSPLKNQYKRKRKLSPERVRKGPVKKKKRYHGESEQCVCVLGGGGGGIHRHPVNYS